MKNDSNITKRERTTSDATMSRVEPEELSRFEGEGGRQVPEQRGPDERPASLAWKEIVVRYQKPSVGRGVWQIVNTLVPYAALWCLMYLSLGVSYWLVVPLAILAGAFMVRVFIIHHDCGHGSFFKSRTANNFLGYMTGVLTFTPYHHWRWEHAAHHSTSGDLDRRGMGDIWTLTVQEYLESSRWKQSAYRMARTPALLFPLATHYMLLVNHRY